MTSDAMFLCLATSRLLNNQGRNISSFSTEYLLVEYHDLVSDIHTWIHLSRHNDQCCTNGLTCTILFVYAKEGYLENKWVRLSDWMTSLDGWTTQEHQGAIFSNSTILRVVYCILLACTCDIDYINIHVATSLARGLPGT